MARRRLDSELVRRGLVTSRQEAQELVSEGRVLVDGAPAHKPARLVAPSEAVRLTDGPRRYVSRGGRKLEAALDRFAVDVTGRTCMDAGASTGGFTDCLLQRGAATVVAVDVGHGQLDPRLRADLRVTVLERTNVRDLVQVLEGVAAPSGEGGAEDGTTVDQPGAGPAGWAGRFDAVVADLSFISLSAAVPVLCGDLAAPDADVILLVKPQFEVGRAAADRGRGVVRDPGLRRDALGRVASACTAAGASIMGAMASPLLGPAGNAEFLLHCRAHATAVGAGVAPGVSEALDAAVAEAPDA